MGQGSGQNVVLLHGILRTHRSMWQIALAMKLSGYRVLNLGYPSTRMPLEKLVDYIYPHIDRFMQGQAGPLHFVGYSMGCLLIRAYIHKYRPAMLGRVVMLAPPNKGSEIADAVRDWRLYQFLFGPAGQQLVTDQSDIKHLFGAVDYSVGVLAGDVSIDPFFARHLPHPHDGKVSVESTKLDGMADHRVIRAAHTFFPGSFAAIRQALHFLHHGKFE